MTYVDKLRTFEAAVIWICFTKIENILLLMSKFSSKIVNWGRKCDAVCWVRIFQSYLNIFIVKCMTNGCVIIGMIILELYVSKYKVDFFSWCSHMFLYAKWTTFFYFIHCFPPFVCIYFSSNLFLYLKGSHFKSAERIIVNFWTEMAVLFSFFKYSRSFPV